MFRVLFLLAVIALSGCSPVDNNNSNTIATGLPPIANIAQRIAGDKFKVITALPEGRSPHDFAPRPATIGEISKAKLYLYTGLPFETNIATALKGAPVKTINIAQEVKRIPMVVACDHDHDHDHHGHGQSQLDPHVWLSIVNCRQMASSICAELIEAYPESKAIFEANLQALNKELDAVAGEMKTKLAPYKNRTFFVHHAAFGYYAHEAGLKQQSVELGGREISPARLAEVIKLAKESGVKTIFVQPQFSPEASKALAEAIDGFALPLDPLKGDIIANFKQLNHDIAEGFNKQ